jgi:hypothetical protein
MRSAAKRERVENFRGTLLFSLGLFPDPKIVKIAMHIVLTDELDSRQSLLTFPLTCHRTHRTLPRAIATQDTAKMWIPSSMAAPRSSPEDPHRGAGARMHPPVRGLQESSGAERGGIPATARKRALDQPEVDGLILGGISLPKGNLEHLPKAGENNPNVQSTWARTHSAIRSTF